MVNERGAWGQVPGGLLDSREANRRIVLCEGGLGTRNRGMDIAL